MGKLGKKYYTRLCTFLENCDILLRAHQMMCQVLWSIGGFLVMVFPTQSLLRRLAGGATVLVLILLLVACGGGNSTQSNSTTGGTSANPVKQIVPTMQATSAAIAQATGAATAAKISLTKTYTGSGFTIQYPADWKVTTASTEIAFTDPSGGYNMTLGSSPNPNGTKTADQLADGGITGAKANLKNVQTVDVPPTTIALNGQSSEIEAVVLANDHPVHTTATKGNVIVYVAAKDQFDQAQTKYFVPMLESFKYTV
jgi:hypothetical protein